MKKQAGTIIGKSVKLATSFRPHGGHALPGLVVQTIFPSYVDDMLRQLPKGVVLVTGTNGKTTTTKILVHLLEANGVRVITNSTGSNMVRGIASSLIRHSSLGSKLPFDIAVFEVDEASAKHLVAEINPRWVLALNVSRDQLDRFGEVDAIAKHIGYALSAATDGIVTNADDPHLSKISREVSANKKIKLDYFGVAPDLAKYFPSDYDLAAIGGTNDQKTIAKTKLEVGLSAFDGQQATYKIGSNQYKAKMKLTGQHNFQNGAAALALAKRLLPDVEPKTLVDELSRVTIAFGRGESYKLKNGAVVELVLVKNPASFRQALASYSQNSDSLMIAINDNVADGRDVSWLWDVDFSSLQGKKTIITSGTRSADMALRLSYDNITTSDIEPSLTEGLSKLSATSGKKVILATYTAMLNQYELLNRIAEKI
ncbi:DUF1727 domain-containing protein [Candidatus Saccharibacteria bacterium]|nr:DUF1727 domain-containing protein [Candidatus Saccharibacteria bacterium]